MLIQLYFYTGCTDQRGFLLQEDCLRWRAGQQTMGGHSCPLRLQVRMGRAQGLGTCLRRGGSSTFISRVSGDQGFRANKNNMVHTSPKCSRRLSEIGQIPFKICYLNLTGKSGLFFSAEFGVSTPRSCYVIYAL